MTQAGDGVRTYVGRRVPHESSALHVTGRARYTDDLILPAGTLHAWPVQSVHAHARILAIDASTAKHLPGVVAVLGASDVPGENNSGPLRHDEPLFPEIDADRHFATRTLPVETHGVVVDSVQSGSNPVSPVPRGGDLGPAFGVSRQFVHYHGQAVAWVLAETVEQARVAAGAVNVQYEVREPLLDLREAIDVGSFHSDPQWMRTGDIDAVLALATVDPDVVMVSGECETGAQDHFPLETHIAVAVADEDGRILIHCSTQHPSETQAIVAHALGLPLSSVVVQCVRMGGGFGGKETQANAWAAIAAIGLWRTGRPVKVRLDRDRHMMMTGKRHPFLARYRAAIGRDGRLRGLDLALYADGGWSLDLSDAVLGRAMFHADNAYSYPAMRVRGQVVRTNRTSQTAFRGFGGPQGMVIGEEIIDRLARAVGLDPTEVRARNLYADRGPRGTTHYGQEIGDTRLAEIWESLYASSSYGARQAEIGSWNRSADAVRRRRRRGIAIVPVKFGISFTTTFLNQAGALVVIYTDGSVQVNHGGTEMGQGLHTKIAQIAADTLGVRFDAVRTMPTRTDKVPNTSATAASSGSDLNGAAVREACLMIRERLCPVAADLLNQIGRTGSPTSDAEANLVKATDVVFRDGEVWGLDHTRRIAFPQVAMAAHRARVSLSQTGYYRTPDIWFDRTTGIGRPFHYFACGASVSEVEIDGFTGEMELRRVDILHDVGESLNPLVDTGQVEGGFVQGMGWLTMEEVVWGRDGRLLTHAPSTYKVPAATDIPADWNVTLLARASQPGVVFGSKAVGEPPFMLALSVREAIRMAVASFGPDGVNLPAVPLRLPATGEAILDAINAVDDGRERQSAALPARTAYHERTPLPVRESASR